MKKKLLALLFLITSSVAFFPADSPAMIAAPAAKTSPHHIRVQIGRNRGRHRGWYQGRHYGWYQGRRLRRSYDNDYDPRMARRIGRWNQNGTVRQVYWVNGRRYTRWVRSY